MDIFFKSKNLGPLGPLQKCILSIGQQGVTLLVVKTTPPLAHHVQDGKGEGKQLNVSQQDILN